MKTIPLLALLLITAISAMGQGAARVVPTLARLLQINPYAVATGDVLAYEVISPTTSTSWGAPRVAFWTPAATLAPNGTNVFPSPFGGRWVFMDKDDPIQNASWYGFPNLYAIDSHGNLTLGNTNVAGKLSSLDAAVQNRAFLVHFHDAADVNSGRFTANRLGNGTPTTNTFLRGDGEWAIITTNGTSIGAGGSSMTVKSVTVTNLTDSPALGWSIVGQEASPYILSGAHITNAFLPGATVGSSLTALDLGTDTGPFGLLYEMMGRSVISGRVIAMDAPKARTVLDAAWAKHTHTSFQNLTILDQLWIQSLNVLTKFSEVDVSLTQRQGASPYLTNVVQDTQTNFFFAGDNHDYRAVTTNAIPGLIGDLANLGAHRVFVKGLATTNFDDIDLTVVSGIRGYTNGIGWRVVNGTATPFIKSNAVLHNPQFAIINSPTTVKQLMQLGGVTNLHVPYFSSTPPIGSASDTNTIQMRSTDFGTIITNANLAYITNVVLRTGSDMTGDLNLLGGANLSVGGNTTNHATVVLGNLTVSGTTTLSNNLSAPSITLGGATRTSFDQLQTGDVILTNILANASGSNFWAGDHTYKAITTNMIQGLVGDIAAAGTYRVAVKGTVITNIDDVGAGATASVGWVITNGTATARVKAGAIIRTPRLAINDYPAGAQSLLLSGGVTNLGIAYFTSRGSVTPDDDNPLTIRATDLGTIITNAGLAYGVNYLPIIGGTLTGPLTVPSVTVQDSATVNGDLLVTGGAGLLHIYAGSIQFTDTSLVTSWNQVQGGSVILTNIQANAATNAFWAGDHVYRVVTTNMIPGLNAMFGRDIDGSNVVSGYVPVARLGSGSPTTNTFLRGDGSWAALTTNGSVTAGTTNAIWVKGNYVTNFLDGPNVSFAISGQQAFPYIPIGASVTNLNSVGTLTSAAITASGDITAASSTLSANSVQANSLLTKASIHSVNDTASPYLAFFDNDPTSLQRTLYAVPMAGLFTNVPNLQVKGSPVTNLLDTGSQIQWTVTGKTATPSIRSGAHLTNMIAQTPLIETSVNRAGFVSTLGSFGVENTSLLFVNGITGTNSAASMQAVDLGTIVTNVGLAYATNYVPKTGGTYTGSLILSNAANLTLSSGNLLVGGNATVTSNLTVTQSITLGSTRTSFDQLQTGNLILTNVLATVDPTNFWAGDHTYRPVTTNAIPGLVRDILSFHPMTVESQVATNIFDPIAATNNIGWTLYGQQALAFVKPGSRLTQNELIHPTMQSTVDAAGFNTILTTVGAANTYIPFYLTAAPGISANPLEAVDLASVVSGLGLAYAGDYLPLTGGELSGDLTVRSSLYVTGDTLLNGSLDVPDISTSLIHFNDGTSLSSMNQVQGGSSILTNIQGTADPSWFWAGNHVYKAVTTNMVPGLVGDVANLQTSINRRQLGSLVLTNVSNLTGGTSNNFFAGDGVFKTITTNMIPGLVQDILNAAALPVGGGGTWTSVGVNGEYRNQWDLVDSPSIVWDKSVPPLFVYQTRPIIKPTGVLPLHLHPTTVALFALVDHNHVGFNGELWLSDSTITRPSFTTVIGKSASASSLYGTALGASVTVTGTEGSSFGAASVVTAARGTALGTAALTTHPESTSVGYAAVTTAANQIRLGRESETVSIPGLLQIAGTTTIGSTNVALAIAGKADLGHDHPASAIVSGVMDPARLASSGTPSGSTFLRGDQTWSVPSGSPSFVASGVSVGVNITGSLLLGVRSGETLTFAANTLANKLIHVQAMGTWSTATSNWSGNEMKIVIGGFSYKYTTVETGSEEFTNENWKFDVFIPASQVSSTWGTFDRRTDRPNGSVLGFKTWVSESAAGTGSITLTNPNTFDLYFTNGAQSMNDVTCTRVVVTIL
jgi:hypothetical protein